MLTQEFFPLHPGREGPIVVTAIHKALISQAWKWRPWLLPTFPLPEPRVELYLSMQGKSYLFFRVEESVWVWFSSAVIKTMTEHNLGTKGFISSCSSTHGEGKAGQELKAGIWRQEPKQRSWRVVLILLACALWFAQPAFFYSLEPSVQEWCHW